MSFDEDDDIFDDFLVEAGEILDQLSEQVVALEQAPSDINLLNAIFRGFHTVKGSAGFLKLDAMVDCCHKTESVFDLLRTGKRTVTPDLMDVVLQALDTINSQYQQVSKRIVPEAADSALLAKLDAFFASDQNPKGTKTNTQAIDISDEEFEAYLDAIDSTVIDSTQAEQDTAPDQDHITEEEFEALLDQLHGKGNAPRGKSKPTESDQNTPASDLDVPSTDSATPQSDKISDDEFEHLLDQLHGVGNAPGAGGKTKTLNAEPAISEEDKKAIVSGDDDFNDLILQLQKPETPSSKVPSELPVAPSEGGSQNPNQRNTGQSNSETTVRVDTRRLDDIMNTVGELVLVRNRLVRLGLDSTDEALSKAVGNLDVVTANLQSSVMLTRMQPIKKVFGRFPRVVRDLARSMKKEIHLELIGEDTDLDKNLVEALVDPLVHLVRNAVDHGIELPDVREALGKPRTGNITLSAEQEGDHILLAISDDGAGMDPAQLKKKAIEKGVLDEDAAARLSDVDAFNLIFAPGFSTKLEISDISGRGVGMDVVKTKITQLNGRIDIESTPGKGTCLAIKVPLTLAIMPTLMIMLEQQCFALPLASVNEIFHMDLTRTNTVDGQECVMIRDKAIPIFHLKKWLVKNPGPVRNLEEAHVVIVSVGTRRIGFVVDKLIGQEEVVIKPLGKMLHGTPGMAGATITGDGTIALIIDVPSLLNRYTSCIPA